MSDFIRMGFLRQTPLEVREIQNLASGSWIKIYSDTTFKLVDKNLLPNFCLINSVSLPLKGGSSPIPNAKFYIGKYPFNPEDLSKPHIFSLGADEEKCFSF